MCIIPCFRLTSQDM